ncbi:Unknown protein [Striga hermonthica]|uniref:Uncharacterized protein n=1 Tax=Striga hermonthica TaxID=68872 RepID=A0A9N7P5U5_STRHE|nr:Unknown protein [Striga hermonthica]
MNNITTSDYSSGSESGWTTYWAQLSDSVYSNYDENISAHNIVNKYGGVDNDDNLSMLSDASSGPRQKMNEDNCSSFSGSKKSSNRKNKTREDEKHNSHFCLDDTATSTFLHFEREPSPKQHLGYTKPSTKGKSGVNAKFLSGGVRGRKMQ